MLTEKKEDIYYEEEIENNYYDSTDSNENTYIEKNYKTFSIDMPSEIKSENFLGKPVEFNFNNNNNNLEKGISDNINIEPNSQSCEDSLQDSLFDEKIYDEENYNYEELTKENCSIDRMNIYITKDFYNELLEGNEEILSTLLNIFNKYESKKKDSNNLLNKKRDNSSKKSRKNEKQAKK